MCFFWDFFGEVLVVILGLGYDIEIFFFIIMLVCYLFRVCFVKFKGKKKLGLCVF